MVLRGAAELVDEAFAALRAVDVSACDADGLDGVRHHLARVEGWVELQRAAVVARADELAEAGRAPRAEDADGRRRSSRARQREAKRARAITDTPGLGDALAAGAMGAEHADALANLPECVDDETRAELVDAAGGQSPEAFAALCRRTAQRAEGRDRPAPVSTLRRWDDTDTGQGVLHGEFDAELRAIIWPSIDAEIERLWRHAHDTDPRSTVTKNARLAAQALANLVQGRPTTHHQPRADIAVHIDLQTLIDGLHDQTVAETADGQPLSVEAIRRLACDANLIPVVLGRVGEVLDVGRGYRTATRAQRSALEAMYPTCGFPGYSVPVSWCQIHHLHPWEHGGTTDLHNLLPLCHRHHHLVHDSHWRLTLDPTTRTLSVHRPDGTHHATAPLQPRTSRGSPPIERAA